MKYRFHRKFLRSRAVRNDAGFEVEFKGMVRIRYSEPGKSVTFWSEPATMDNGEFKGRSGWVIGISKPTEWDDGTLLNDPERKLIQERTKDALKFMGVPHIAT